MKGRAQRRHDFLRVTAEGERRHRAKAAIWGLWNDDPPHVRRDRFRRAWCSCSGCQRDREFEGPTIQELRFACDDGGDE
jgi:hypothetical protein